MSPLAPALAERRRLAVTGTVQGVGFRPFVYRLAAARGLAGWVRNTGGGVDIEIEGEPAALDAFAAALLADPPPLARIEGVRSHTVPPTGAVGFRILESGAAAAKADGGAAPGARPLRAPAAGDEPAPPLPVGPDAPPCPACLAEVRDPAARRHGYPFTNCTDCGPRFTIIRALPYDRARTTMAAFPLCDACAAEYRDAGDRRFHAEPNACPACGPRLRWVEGRGAADPTRESGAAAGALEAGRAAPRPDAPLLGEEALAAAAAALLAGHIVALKGVGGYQLACDATRGAAVRRLRRRKAREAKPLAVMVADLEAARRLCRVGAAEAALLASARAPIVLLARRGRGVAGAVAPGLRRLGVMLPSTPLHHLLLARVGRPLVMTSGNRSGEPIAMDDDEARERLGDVADAFLAHDRPIAARYDDSVARVDGGAPLVLRRARGYAPEPLRLPRPAPRPGLATGAQLKAAFCLVHGRHAFLSQHIGDLDDARAAAHWAETLALYRRLFRIDPEWVAHDLHPDYACTRFAQALPSQVRRFGVQHHHAHVMSCLAEHGRTGAVLGVCFDGAGWGDDGTVWGGELLLVNGADCRRLAHLRHLPMPGGDAAAREPWRMAAAALVETLGPQAEEAAETLLARVSAARRRAVLQMARRRVSAPLTSSAGRLFDAVAALAGVRAVNRYEGQAAMELEARVDAAERSAYPLPLRADGVWDSAELVAAVVADVRRGAGAGRIAARFHEALARAVADACRGARARTGVDVVVLTGGCFQNRRLAARARALLRADGFEVLRHGRVPPNDGGLALGQAAVAVARLGRA